MSWLQQFEVDMRAVAAFLPAAQVLLDICLTRFALRGSLNGGLPRSIAGYAQHRQDWSNKPATTEPATHLTFSPAWATHLSLRHGRLSPVRHVAPVAYCVACLCWYHSVSRVHHHLKHFAAVPDTPPSCDVTTHLDQRSRGA